MHKVGKWRENPREILRKQFCAASSNSVPVPQEPNLRVNHRKLLSMGFFLLKRRPKYLCGVPTGPCHRKSLCESRSLWEFCTWRVTAQTEGINSSSLSQTQPDRHTVSNQTSDLVHESPFGPLVTATVSKPPHSLLDTLSSRLAAATREPADRKRQRIKV